MICFGLAVIFPPIWAARIVLRLRGSPRRQKLARVDEFPRPCSEPPIVWRARARESRVSSRSETSSVKSQTFPVYDEIFKNPGWSIR